MENENKWEYDYSPSDTSPGDTGYKNVGSSGNNAANQYAADGMTTAPVPTPAADGGNTEVVGPDPQLLSQSGGNGGDDFGADAGSARFIRIHQNLCLKFFDTFFNSLFKYFLSSITYYFFILDCCWNFRIFCINELKQFFFKSSDI